MVDGRQVVCDPNPAVSTDASLAACVGSLAGFAQLCPLKVGEIVDCTQAVGADLCQIYVVPACKPVATCLKKLNGTD